MGRLKSALRTLILGDWDRELRERRAELDLQAAADRKQVRELTAELEDALEKYGRLLAREAKRRNREAKQHLEEIDSPAQLTLGEPDVQTRKSQLRQRLLGNGHVTAVQRSEGNRG